MQRQGLAGQSPCPFIGRSGTGGSRTWQNGGRWAPKVITMQLAISGHHRGDISACSRYEDLARVRRCTIPSRMPRTRTLSTPTTVLFRQTLLRSLGS